jgi:hypothetical protein
MRLRSAEAESPCGRCKAGCFTLPPVAWTGSGSLSSNPRRAGGRVPGSPPCSALSAQSRRHLNETVRQLRVVEIRDVIAVFRQLLRVGMAYVAQHVETHGNKNGLR